MSSSVSLTELLGRRVVALDDATEIGEIKAVVLDRSASRVERVQVSGRKRSPELVDWGQVQSIGDDAVMITSGADVHESRNADDDKSYVRGDIEILGAGVITVSGFAAGEVEDLHIDMNSGQIDAAMTTAGRVPSSNIKSLGTFGLVIA